MNEVILEQTDDGELYFQLPDDIIERLGWNEGCELEFCICEGNGFMIRKVVAHSE